MGNCLCVKPATKDEVTTLNTREAPPAHFMIKIESFNVLEKYGIKKYETKEFVAGDYKWRLIFKFNGKDSDYISVNLAMADTTSLPTNREVNALFSVFLFNQISGNYLSSTEITAMETREASPAHLLVKIESFSLLGTCSIDEYETREFVAEDYKWRLIIYFNGKNCEYVSVSLAMADTSSLPANWEVNVVFNIFLYNQISGNYLSSPGRTRCFLETKSEWGISKFISKKILSDPSNGYLVNDNIVFGAEVFVVKKDAIIECVSLNNINIHYKHDFSFHQ
ncbi:PREDICTED: ubiquitin carboxyl-terminal hydrolase 12-like [Erythranthe guttata]|nr:PREDICTED: ubiquitin carboxyl-terminal hydrolase 12-like [Erythranthe guttata]|eukprot:XP_012851649.1 PREDICTED: ubiquitin carboxyl-terminal hydrolase 12-like [Erythranthe guttata]